MPAKNKIRILWLEDCPVYKLVVETMLSETKLFSYELYKTGTVKETLSVLENNIFDVILLDLIVPDSKGIETLKKIHAAISANIPLIVISGIDNDQLFLQARQYGVYQYLVKGKFTANILCRGILYAIENQSLMDELLKIKHQQEAILSNIPDMAWLKDRESIYIAVNEPFGKSCGFSPSDIVGKNDLELWPEDLAKQYIADDMEVIKTGKRNC